MDPYKDFIRLPSWLYHLLAETPFLWIIIPVIGLALVLIPFFIVWRKCKPVGWREVGVAFLSSILIFGGLEFLRGILFEWIWWHIYNGGWILHQYDNGFITFWGIFTLFFIFSPFFVFKKIYNKLNLKKIILCILLSILLTCLAIWLWIQVFIWALGTVHDKYL